MLASQFKKKKLKSKNGVLPQSSPSDQNLSIQENQKDENVTISSNSFSFNFDLPDSIENESDLNKKLSSLLGVSELDNHKIKLKQKKKKKKKKKKNEFERKENILSIDFDCNQQDAKQTEITQVKKLLSIDENKLTPTVALNNTKSISSNLSLSKVIDKNSTIDPMKNEKIVENEILLQNSIEISKMNYDDLDSPCSTDQKQNKSKVDTQNNKIQEKINSSNENILNYSQNSMQSIKVESLTIPKKVTSQDFEIGNKAIKNDPKVQKKSKQLKTKDEHEKVFSFNFDLSPNDNITNNIPNNNYHSMSQLEGKNGKTSKEKKREKKKKRKKRKKEQQQSKECNSNEYQLQPLSKDNLFDHDTIETPSSQVSNDNESSSTIKENIELGQSQRGHELNILNTSSINSDRNLETSEDKKSHTMNLNAKDSHRAESSNFPSVLTKEKGMNDKNELSLDHNNFSSKKISAFSNENMSNLTDNLVLKEQSNEKNVKDNISNSSSTKHAPIEVTTELKQRDSVIKARLKAMKKNKEAKKNKKKVVTKAYRESMSQDKIKDLSSSTKQKQILTRNRNEKTLLKKQKLSFDSSVQAKATVNKRSLILHRLNKLKRENGIKIQNNSLQKMQQNQNDTSHTFPTNLNNKDSFFAFDFNVQNKDLSPVSVPSTVKSQNYPLSHGIGQTEEKMKQIEYMDVEKKDKGNRAMRPNRKKDESLSFNTSDKGKGMVNKNSMILYKRKKLNGPTKDWTKTPVGSLLNFTECETDNSTTTIKRGFDNAFSFGFSFNLN